MGCLAHWPPSTFAQFGLFTTTLGCLAPWPLSAFLQFVFPATKMTMSGLWKSMRRESMSLRWRCNGQLCCWTAKKRGKMFKDNDLRWATIFSFNDLESVRNNPGTPTHLWCHRYLNLWSYGTWWDFLKEYGENAKIWRVRYWHLHAKPS